MKKEKHTQGEISLEKFVRRYFFLCMFQSNMLYIYVILHCYTTLPASNKYPAQGKATQRYTENPTESGSLVWPFAV